MDSNARIYLYDDPIKFLLAELKRLKQEEKRFSLREWSRRLGYENPSYLSDVLKGKRKLKISLSVLIASSLRLDERATRYLELMTLIHQTREASEKRHLAKLLNSMRPQELKNSTSLSAEQFALIADWHNWALIEMPALRGFRPEAKAIVKRLGGRVSQEAVEESLGLLVKYGLLGRDAEGRVKRRSSSEPAVLEPGVSKAAVREYQKQMAKQALAALESQKSEEIDFQGTTFAFLKKDLPELKRIVREFHQRALALSQTEGADEVCQLNSQFFRLT